MSASSCVGLTFLFVVLSLPVVGLKADGADNAPQRERKVTIKQIKAAWEARQKKIKTARVKWKETHIYSAGYMSSLWKCLGPRNAEINPNNLTIPPRSATLEVTGAFVMDRDKYRYEYYMPAWSKKKQAMIATPGYAVTNRGNQVKFTPEGAGDQRFPYGNIAAGRRMINPGVPQLRAVTMALAPVTPTLKVIHLDSYRLTEKPVLFGGNPCVELYVQHPGIGSATEKLYLDSAKDYNVVGFEVLSPLGKYHSMQIEYRQLSNGIWVPSKWRNINRQQDKSTHLIEGISTEVEINSTVHSKEFQIDFPPGTLVSDDIARKRYMVRPDGSKRTISLDELADKQYQEIKDEVDAEYSATRRRWKLITFGVCTAGVVVCSWIIYRRRRRSSAAPPQSPPRANAPGM